MNIDKTIGIVGLGLIGGSFAKAAVGAGFRVLGMTRNRDMALFAEMEGAISAVITEKELSKCDIVILAMPPAAVLNFLRKNGDKFAPRSTVIDICGVKRAICPEAWRIAKKHNFEFVGGHPMAGKEKAGFRNSSATLFAGASMILCFEKTPEIEHLAELKAFFLALGFGKVVKTTPENHDRVIACTSQLAHILSGAYVRTPAALEHAGFSAGSFRDMIRVASMDPALWRELFIDNSDFLTGEIDTLIGNLQRFRDAIANKDAAALEKLISESAELKQRIDAKRAIRA